MRRVEVAEQVLDRMEHRGGVGLDAHSIVGLEVLEPQCGHRGDKAGTGRLMAPDLDAIGIGTLAVSTVDHADRKPQHALLDLLQCLEVRAARPRTLHPVIDERRPLQTSCAWHGPPLVLGWSHRGHDASLPATPDNTAVAGSDRTARHLSPHSDRCRPATASGPAAAGQQPEVVCCGQPHGHVGLGDAVGQHPPLVRLR